MKTSFAQEATNVQDWVLIENQVGYRVEYRYADCLNPQSGMDKREVYLKFTNLTNKEMTLNWEYDVSYDGKCINCDGDNDEMKFTIVIPPNSSVEGTCGDNNANNLTIFAEFLNIDGVRKMTSFHVKNIFLAK
jgi:hypothetical protein